MACRVSFPKRIIFIVVLAAISAPAEGMKRWPWWPCRQALLGDHLVYLPRYVPPTVEVLAAPLTDIIKYQHGVTATLTSRNIDQILRLQRQGVVDWGAVDLMAMRRGAATIRVTRKGGRDENFSRENRSLDFYRRVFFPSTILNAAALEGKRVFDAGCGSQGTAVRQMRDEGIMAFGGDIYLDETVRESPHLAMLDLLAPPLAANQFDLVLAAYGPVSYSDEVEVSVRQAILKQMFRLARPHGGVLISPYHLEDVQQMVQALRLSATVEEVSQAADDGRLTQAVLVRKKK